jgi:hypothetical protein
MRNPDWCADVALGQEGTLGPDHRVAASNSEGSPKATLERAGHDRRKRLEGSNRANAIEFLRNCAG